MLYTNTRIYFDFKFQDCLQRKGNIKKCKADFQAVNYCIP